MKSGECSPPIDPKKKKQQLEKVRFACSRFGFGFEASVGQGDDTGPARGPRGRGELVAGWLRRNPERRYLGGV